MTSGAQLLAWVRKHEELLDMERDGERAQFDDAIASLSAKECQKAGLSVLSLQIESIGRALFGRSTICLKRLDGQAFTSPFKAGDEVTLYNTKHMRSKDEQTSAMGIVKRTAQNSIDIITDEFEESHLFEPPLRLDVRSSQKTFNKMKEALSALRSSSHPLTELLFYPPPASISSPPAGSSSSVGAARVKDLLRDDSSLPYGLLDRKEELSALEASSLLNPSQIEAIRVALAARHIALIHGPPGTGKTSTLAELIKQMVQRGQRVLVCAPSNVAVDNILLHLASHQTSSSSNINTNTSSRSTGRDRNREKDNLGANISGDASGDDGANQRGETSSGFSRVGMQPVVRGKYDGYKNDDDDDGRDVARLGDKVDSFGNTLAVNPAIDAKLEDVELRMVRLGHPARINADTLRYSLDYLIDSDEGTSIVRDVREDIDKVRGQLRNFQTRNNAKARAASSSSSSDAAAGKSAGKGKGVCSTRNELRAELRSLNKEARKRERSVVCRIVRSSNVVLATCIGASARLLRGDGGEGAAGEKGARTTGDTPPPFDCVVIDEAAQALEASCWVPILLGRKCVLAGDHCQLPPTVKSEEAAQKGLSVTLFERIMRDHGLHRFEPVIQMLDTQYRMNARISDWASKEMYDSKLISHPSVASHTLSDILGKPDQISVDSTGTSIRGNGGAGEEGGVAEAVNDSAQEMIAAAPSPRIPVALLIDTDGCNMEEELHKKDLSAQQQQPEGNNTARGGRALSYQAASTASHRNLHEAQLVRRHVLALVLAGVHPTQIGVITPYNGQLELLRDLLLHQPLPELSVTRTGTGVAGTAGLESSVDASNHAVGFTTSSGIPTTGETVVRRNGGGGGGGAVRSLEGLEIKTIDGFQGGEKECIVLSLVRSNAKREVGFLGDNRRINVGVTRAKRHLAVVCDSSTCSANPFIGSLLDHISAVGEHISADEYKEYGLMSVLEVDGEVEERRDYWDPSDSACDYDNNNNDAVHANSAMNGKVDAEKEGKLLAPGSNSKSGFGDKKLGKARQSKISNQKTMTERSYKTVQRIKGDRNDKEQHQKQQQQQKQCQQRQPQQPVGGTSMDSLRDDFKRSVDDVISRFSSICLSSTDSPSHPATAASANSTVAIPVSLSSVAVFQAERVDAEKSTLMLVSSSADVVRSSEVDQPDEERAIPSMNTKMIAMQNISSSASSGQALYVLTFPYWLSGLQRKIVHEAAERAAAALNPPELQTESADNGAGCAVGFLRGRWKFTHESVGEGALRFIQLRLQRKEESSVSAAAPSSSLLPAALPLPPSTAASSFDPPPPLIDDTRTSATASATAGAGGDAKAGSATAKAEMERSARSAAAARAAVEGMGQSKDKSKGKGKKNVKSKEGKGEEEDELDEDALLDAAIENNKKLAHYNQYRLTHTAPLLNPDREQCKHKVHSLIEEARIARLAQHQSRSKKEAPSAAGISSSGSATSSSSAPVFTNRSGITGFGSVSGTSGAGSSSSSSSSSGVGAGSGSGSRRKKVLKKPVPNFGGGKLGTK